MPVEGPAPASPFAPTELEWETRSSIVLSYPAPLEPRVVAGQAHSERVVPVRLDPCVRAWPVRVERAPPSRSWRMCSGTESRTRS